MAMVGRPDGDVERALKAFGDLSLKYRSFGAIPLKVGHAPLIGGTMNSASYDAMAFDPVAPQPVSTAADAYPLLGSALSEARLVATPQRAPEAAWLPPVPSQSYTPPAPAEPPRMTLAEQALAIPRHGEPAPPPPPAPVRHEPAPSRGYVPPGGYAMASPPPAPRLNPAPAELATPPAAAFITPHDPGPLTAAPLDEEDAEFPDLPAAGPILPGSAAMGSAPAPLIERPAPAAPRSVERSVMDAPAAPIPVPRPVTPVPDIDDRDQASLPTMFSHKRPRPPEPPPRDLLAEAVGLPTPAPVDAGSPGTDPASDLAALPPPVADPPPIPPVPAVRLLAPRPQPAVQPLAGLFRALSRPAEQPGETGADADPPAP